MIRGLKVPTRLSRCDSRARSCIEGATKSEERMSYTAQLRRLVIGEQLRAERRVEVDPLRESSADELGNGSNLD
jgi:hypothetical protein